jgi:hypothetical protein
MSLFESSVRNVLPPQPAEVFNLSSILIPWLFLYCMTCGPSGYGGMAAATDRAHKSADSNARNAVCQEPPSDCLVGQTTSLVWADLSAGEYRVGWISEFEWMTQY